jgi:hypothetical protein
VDTILAEAEAPPIIILQGDHGSKSIRESGDTRVQMLHERLGILNAYCLPGDGDQYLYDSITPANTFRVIFNAYFDTDYQLLEDRSYFCRTKRPYDFMDATDTLAQQ